MTECLGLDVSEGMVTAYNRKVQEAGISSKKMSAKVGDLLAKDVAQELQGPEYHEFDIVIIGSALHHFPDPQLAMNRLAARLKKGGVLFIVEMLANHHNEHEHKQISPETAATVHKHGFSVGEMKEMFSEAGVGADTKVEVLSRPLEMTINDHNIERTVLFARGSKI